MDNITLLQYFHWYYPADGSLWNKLANDSGYLAQLGITTLWLPPATKSYKSNDEAGYAVYDLFDLGEFDQKGSVRTKYGTRDEYLNAIDAAHKANLKVLADAVMNHKAGGDELEKFPVRTVHPLNRKEFTSERFEIESFTKFTFPGRQGKYSNFIWDWHCFSGIDWAEDKKEEAIYSIQNEYGDGWEDLIEEELGNYDFLMFADIETRNPAVRDELKYWGEWYLNTTHVDGFRLDAIKHISPQFMNEWVSHILEKKNDLFIVGEYWSPEKDALLQYIHATQGNIQLFDAPLHFNLHEASLHRNEYDLRNIFNNTLLQANPTRAVTLVDNHDTQPLQALESPVDFWFKPLAYALILLREQGIPCVFYPALYGVEYTDRGADGNDHTVTLSKVNELEQLIPIRYRYAYGFQRDFLDHPNTIGWTREGDADHPDSGIAVLMSNGDEGFKKMEIGKLHTGKTFRDIFGYRQEKITIDNDGWGEFLCNAGSVSVWVLDHITL